MIQTEPVTAVMRALADPTRRAVFERIVNCEEITVVELTRGSNVTQGAISQHLKVLREARLVRVRVDGQRRIYGIDPSGLDEIDGWVQRVRGFWHERLDALERELIAADMPQEGGR